MEMNREDAKITRRSQRVVIDVRTERVSHVVIGAAIEVHRTLGPGYVEDVYEQALAHEFDLRAIRFSKQFFFNVRYKGQPVGKGRLDFLVEECLIVELKAVEALSDLHTQQVIAYLQATGHHLGLIINFNVPVLKAGLQRVIF
jgi:GxxExxY protein